MKLVGQIVTDKLSGKLGIVTKKKKGKYRVLFWMQSAENWMKVECRKEQLEMGDKTKKIGYGK